MTERNKPHNGRDLAGHYRVKQQDVDDVLANPDGSRFVRDDVRLGGAVADTGVRAGEAGERIERMIEANTFEVAKAAGAPIKKGKRRRA